MATRGVTLRCPACGLDVTATVALSPPTQWFPCPRCHAPIPVVVPRELPPLYTWEVSPELYPPFPRPRPVRRNLRRATLSALLAVVLLASAFGALLGAYGVTAADSPGTTVSGTVLAESTSGSTSPAPGATVVLTEDGGGQRTGLTGADGAFLFSGVPAGGDAINITLRGYAPIEIDTFASSVYDTGTQGLVVTLVPGGNANGSTVSLAGFPDLETLLASIGSAALLFGLVAAIAATGSVLLLRRDRPALGVVGGGAGFAAPFVLYLLGLEPVFPLVVAATGTLAAFGAFALAVGAFELWQSGAAVEAA